MAIQHSRVKATSEGLALQATGCIQRAGLVNKSTTKDEIGAGRDVIVYGFDDALMIVDEDTTHVYTGHRAELLSSAAEESGSIHFGQRSTVSCRDSEYLAHLSGCEAAGIYENNEVGMKAVDGVLFVFKPNHEAAELISGLVKTRRRQIEFLE